MDYDETRLYFTHQQLQKQPDGEDIDDNDGVDGENDHPNRRNSRRNTSHHMDGDDNINLEAVRRHFREFLSKFVIVAVVVVVVVLVFVVIVRICWLLLIPFGSLSTTLPKFTTLTTLTLFTPIFYTLLYYAMQPYYNILFYIM
jgi:hypothetical protein